MSAVAEVNQQPEAQRPEASSESLLAELQTSTEQLLDDMLGSHDESDFPTTCGQSPELCFDSDF